MNRQEISQLFPKYNTERIPENGCFFLPKRETVPETFNRAKEILNEIKEFKDQSVCIVMHGILLDIIFTILLNGNYEINENMLAFSKFYIGSGRVFSNCGVSLVELEENEFKIKYIDNVEGDLT